MRLRSPEERLSRAASFNEDAAKYDRARPKYPPEVFDALWQLAGVPTGAQIIEVGCGTGQASLSLAERGVQLTCVEFGENMAALARENLSRYPNVSIFHSAFETWDPGDKRFDLLFASASWHWIDPEVRYQKAASVLKPGGVAAIIESEHVYPEGYDPLLEPIQQVYVEVTGSGLEWPPKPPSLPDDVLSESDRAHWCQIQETGAFESVDVVRVLWPFERTADEYVDLLGTFSDHWARPVEEREELFKRIHKIIADSPTGQITRHYLTTIRIARKKVD